jgi:Carboxypeptidase regulatory-like domain
MQKSLLVLFLASILAVSVSAANAGTTGVLSGYVVDDPSQRPIPHVTVHAGLETTTTDSRGYFIFISLALGRYQLYASDGCPLKAVVSADQENVATLWVSSTKMYDCSFGARARPTDQFGEYSFDADGNPEPRR